MQATPSLRERLGQQLSSGAAPYVLVIAYMVLSMGALLFISREMFLYPLWSSIAFPLFVLSPLVILSARMRPRIKIGLALLMLMLLVPLVGIKDSSYLEFATQIGIFAALALGLNIVIGFAGLLDLGYVAFFAVGAYLWAIFTSSANTFITLNGWTLPSWSFFIFLMLGVIVAALAGILLGLPVLRLRGDYLAIVTLGFGEMIRVLATNLDHPLNITNGPLGLERVSRPPLPPFLFDLMRGIVPTLEGLFGRKLDNPDQLVYQLFFYLLVLLLVGLAVLFAGRLQNSPIGRAWTAIREDEVAAIAMGVPLVRMKLLAFATGAAFAGMIGVVYAAKQTFVSPESFKFEQSIIILAMVIVGGMGSIRGVILGAAVVTLLNLQVLTNLSLLLNSLKSINWIVPIINFPLKQWPTQLDPAKYQRLVFGILLITMMIFRPAGILPAQRRALELRKQENEDDNLAELPDLPVSDLSAPDVSDVSVPEVP